MGRQARELEAMGAAAAASSSRCSAVLQNFKQGCLERKKTVGGSRRE